MDFMEENITMNNDFAEAPEAPEMRRQDELAVLLGRCGRFAGHRVGWVRGQRSVLKALREKDGVSQKELAASLGIMEGSLSELLGKLERRGLITRDRCPDDRRKLVIKITDEGVSEYENEDREKDIFDVLTDEEQEELILLLRKLAVNWRPMMHRGRGHSGADGRDCHGPDGEHHHHHRHGFEKGDDL